MTGAIVAIYMDAMRRGGLLGLALLAGCNQILSLDPTKVAPEPDSDRDGVPDHDDNCPDVPNPMQEDFDSDQIGDACDSCPLLPDARSDSDMDGVDDACDPHPLHKGDCLVLLDTFGDAASFAAHWRVVSAESSPNVVAEAGRVTVTPAASSSGIGVVALGADGNVLTGSAFDVIVAVNGAATTNAAVLGAVSNMSAPSDSLQCGVGYSIAPDNFTVCAYRIATSGSTTGSSTQMSAEPAGDHAVIRLISEASDGTPQLRCRCDYGFAIGATTPQMVTARTTGGAGMFTSADVGKFHAVSIYRFAPGTMCGDAIRR